MASTSSAAETKLQRKCFCTMTMQNAADLQPAQSKVKLKTLFFQISEFRKIYHDAVKQCCNPTKKEYFLANIGECPPDWNL